MEYSFNGKYYVYIVTNDSKDVFEIGVTGDLVVLINRLGKNSDNLPCNQLIHWERFENPMEALMREQELNKLSKKKISRLIEANNPEWKLLNKAFQEKDLFYRV